MADRSLRTLKRRWEATRDEADELAYLQALLRQEALPRPRLLLAGYAGSSAAQQILGARGVPPEPQLSAFVTGLAKGRLGRTPELAREAAARAVLAVFGALVEAELGGPSLLGITQALRAWCGEPSLATQQEVERWAQGTPWSALLTELLGSSKLEVTVRAAGKLVREAAKQLKLVHRQNNVVARAAIERELIDWLLG